MEKFWKELESGEIHFRDKWQFELKSDFSPTPTHKINTYTQEFYLFIPNALQIHSETYPKSQFFKDQTTLIRYKTPEFSLQELIDPKNSLSPLIRLLTVKPSKMTPEKQDWIEDELKLLANIVRSALRRAVHDIYLDLDKPAKEEKKTAIAEDIALFCQDIQRLRKKYSEMETKLLKTWTDETFLREHLRYVNDFISDSITYYLIGLLEKLRISETVDLKESDETLCKVIIEEEQRQEGEQRKIRKLMQDPVQSETIFYQSSMLNKFVLDALLLRTTRSQITSRFRNIIGSIAAGIAMLFFFVLFVWQGHYIAINSELFILFTVILYILKDRIKESLKTISYRQALKWFSDYVTEIYSPEGKYTLGKLKESFYFVNAEEIPDEINKIRNREFHAVLEKFKRPERAIYYKQTLNLLTPKQKKRPRRHDYNIIFRFNIREFLAKADNPYHPYVTLDPNTLQFIRTQLPKVYHLNIILKNTYADEVEYKKFRLIIDKNGIKRVEHLVSTPKL